MSTAAFAGVTPSAPVSHPRPARLIAGGAIQHGLWDLGDGRFQSVGYTARKVPLDAAGALSWLRMNTPEGWGSGRLAHLIAVAWFYLRHGWRLL